MTLPSSWASLFIYLCRTVKTVIANFYFAIMWPKMPPDAGHGKRAPAFVTIFGFPYFSCLQTGLLAISTPGTMADKPVFRQCTAGGTPATASHARMTMAVTGFPSQRQESTAFPLYCCAALCLFPWRVAPFIRPLFLFASPCMPTFPCRLQDGISVSFSLLGQR